MNKLSRILTTVLCFAPVAFASAGPVATTAGNNLTAYNPSNANNNQWAMISNGRYDANNTSAKVDFGNCNALILRCAQPKCSNGGCSDYSVASAIVKGCVQSNSSCKQYGADLEEYMSAQLVASSNAKINEQNAAAQQAAAAAAAQQSQQQMQEMQYQMQQMQAQMAQQQAESQQQLQAALEQQAAQSAAALESMKTAATDSAKTTEAGISAYQQEAIDRGISTDVLERQKITGQIMTELENAEVSLKEVKTAMNSAFEYAKCDARGNNCEGPKRIKKWRELATEFLTPYDNTIDKVYDALELAQLVGVPLSDIYMMLNNSCNRWGQYMCPRIGGGEVVYANNSKGQKGMPYVCAGTPESATGKNDAKSGGAAYAEKIMYCRKYETEGLTELATTCYSDALLPCQPCTLLKVLSSEEEVYEGWVNAETSTDSGNTTVVACASGALDSSALFARRTKNKNGAGLVDIDKMDTWLNQKEPAKKYSGGPDLPAYCNADTSNYKELLEKSVLSKIVPTKGAALCVEKPGYDNATKEDKGECGYISPIYAICDTHLYNVGKESASDSVKKDVFNCTEEAKTALHKDHPKKITKGLDQIVWADKSESAGNVCKIILCKENYKPTEEGCIPQESGWDAKSENYINAKQDYDNHNKELFGDMKEIIGLKTTVISQQMYKQYEYLNATLRRLKTQLEKATLTAALEAAGAKDDDSSSSGLLGSSSKNSQYENCSGKDIQEAIYCLRQNYNAIANQINNKKCNAVKKQLVKDLKILDGKIPGSAEKSDYTKISAKCMDEKTVVCDDCIEEYSNGLNTLDDVRLDKEARRAGRYRD